ncbi:hypothetical protein DEU56DRAFT_315461 [Suillus clintonianus]|uniref:uncharacterized protein n=1 Tax=Suillus clintonianus TaxID=1904413 RepID=UPI001B85E9DA|nr:uncharacterized protein DEU56DRAFT_315461 [Suillus clintonianus]KAG2155609.1 hypothetical protein DEU56DRAFT_315461 [Suillus clintonianus]
MRQNDKWSLKWQANLSQTPGVFRRRERRARDMQPTVPRRASTLNSAAPLSLIGYTADLYSDSRKHGYQGPVRNVRLHRATTNSGGTIAKSEDGLRCVVAGRESLRILRLSDPEDVINNDHKASFGRGGHRIEASRNVWDGCGLKIDSASTDVAWCPTCGLLGVCHHRSC